MNEALRQMIMASAGKLGISPLDLATVISYETAGTFDPLKAGPTTQWGQHKGLIQWGEPQAEKYLGGDFSIPRQGEGIVAYMQDAGVKPGMGLLDVYSAVNAGSVGRYDASDANNGGAPGTVRDKVEQQMSGHRRKAEGLLASARLGGDSMVPRDHSAEVAAQTNTPGGLIPRQKSGGLLADSNPLPGDLGAYWAGKDKPTVGDRIASATAAIANAVPDAPMPRMGGMGDARETGDFLLKYLKSMNALPQGLLAQRYGGGLLG